METFWQWLNLQSLLRETYFSFDAKQYDHLFDDELEKVIARTSHPAHRQALEHLRGFDWLSYIAGWVRHAGFRDYREVQEKTHEVVVTLLTGKLFRGYDPRIHGPMDLRFKASVANTVRNLVAKEKTRRRYLPTTSIAQEFVPGSVTAEELPAKSARDDDSQVIENFREMVLRRLGGLGLPFARQSGEVDDQEGRGGHQGVGEGVRCLVGRSRIVTKDRACDDGRIGNGREEAGGDDGGEAGCWSVKCRADDVETLARARRKSEWALPEKYLMPESLYGLHDINFSMTTRSGALPRGAKRTCHGRTILGPNKARERLQVR
jgi:hypothetical protein